MTNKAPSTIPAISTPTESLLPSPTTYSTHQPTPIGKTTIRGEIKSVAASARVIFLTEPVGTISEVAFTDETPIIMSDGTEKTYPDIPLLQPGMWIEAIGSVVSMNSLLADTIHILDESG